MIVTIVVRCVQGFHTCWRRHPQVGLRSFSLPDTEGKIVKIGVRKIQLEWPVRRTCAWSATDMGD